MISQIKCPKCDQYNVGLDDSGVGVDEQTVYTVCCSCGLETEPYYSKYEAVQAFKEITDVRLLDRCEWCKSSDVGVFNYCTAIGENAVYKVLCGSCSAAGSMDRSKYDAITMWNFNMERMAD
jgi:hypothetical protein